MFENLLDPTIKVWIAISLVHVIAVLTFSLMLFPSCQEVLNVVGSCIACFKDWKKKILKLKELKIWFNYNFIFEFLWLNYEIKIGDNKHGLI